MAPGAQRPRPGARGADQGLRRRLPRLSICTRAFPLRVERLSRREREIFGLLGHGLSIRGIARRPAISNVLIKLRVEPRLQAGSVACLLLARPPLNGQATGRCRNAAPHFGDAAINVYNAQQAA
ncbi:hypothetical protein [Amycolatopsis kentuckyensis]|uniref:hypothetical protein n=1 Tax=Amycolatopsis kentuckyensis TaxID=218823 RepID=UPI003562AF85